LCKQYCKDVQLLEDKLGRQLHDVWNFANREAAEIERSQSQPTVGNQVASFLQGVGAKLQMVDGSVKKVEAALRVSLSYEAALERELAIREGTRSTQTEPGPDTVWVDDLYEADASMLCEERRCPTCRQPGPDTASIAGACFADSPLIFDDMAIQTEVQVSDQEIQVGDSKLAFLVPSPARKQHLSVNGNLCTGNTGQRKQLHTTGSSSTEMTTRSDSSSRASSWAYSRASSSGSSSRLSSVARQLSREREAAEKHDMACLPPTLWPSRIGSPTLSPDELGYHDRTVLRSMPRSADVSRTVQMSPRSRVSRSALQISPMHSGCQKTIGRAGAIKLPNSGSQHVIAAGVVGLAGSDDADESWL